MREPPARVEVNIGVRTMLLAVAVAGAVALALVSLGSLLSIFVAAVLALGLDPVVSRAGRARLAARAGGAGGVRRPVRRRCS